LTQSEAKQKITELVEKYEQIKKSGGIKKYSEAETCKEFILPLFNALGWDTSSKQEVSAEEHTNAKDRADYGFYLNGWPKFYLEAKKLSADIHDERFAKQAIAYSWNKGIAWAALTDFESLKIFNSQDVAEHLSHKLVFEIRYDQFLDRFDQLSLLSKEAFTKNLLDEYGEKHGKKLQRVSVTDTLYKDLNESRLLLLKSFRAWNKEVPADLLEEGVQKLLDRLIFIRVAEDRQLEQPTLIPMLRASGGSATEKFYQSLVAKFRELDKIYNSNLFALHPLEGWQEYDGATEKVIEILHGKTGYYEYNFQAIPADVLGSVYENYLGYQLAQSEKGIEVSKNARKRKEQGIYYTPTYIVDYIVTNALKPVLDKCETVADLKAIKVLDPACGSGSFLIRAVEMIYNKYLEFGANPGEMTKITILLDNIYGVDLDEQAVEIARLNLLINALDSQMRLPDLSKNIKNGNSLISGTDAELEKVFGRNYRDKKPFNWQQEFPQVFERENPGFDVIIGNPPYIRVQALDKDDAEYFKGVYESAKSNYDIYILFIEKGIDTLRSDGRLGMILPNKFMQAEYGEIIRKILTENQFVNKIVDFGDFQVFGDATTYTALLFLSKNRTSLVEFVDADSGFKKLGGTAGLKQMKSHKISAASLTSKAWSMGTGEGQDLLQKISSGLQTLEDLAEKIYVGLQTNADPIYILELVKEKEDHYIVRSKLNGQEYQLEKAVLHPLLRGKEIKRYSTPFYKFLIVLPYMISPESADLIPVKDFKEKYPRTWQYLLGNKKALEDRENGKMKHGRWYGYVYPKNLSKFQSSKIMTQVLASKASFTFDDAGKYYFVGGGNAGGYGVTLPADSKVEYHYLLGLLNSSLLDWYVQQISSKFRGGFYSYAKRFIERLPISVPSEQEQKNISDLVKKLLSLNLETVNVPENSNEWHSLKSEIEKTDNQIDQLVYELYELTPDEISLIESHK